MRKLSILVVTVALLTVALRAESSIAWQGTTYNIHFMPSGVVLFYTSGARSDIPACGAGQPARFAFDSTTAS